MYYYTYYYGKLKMDLPINNMYVGNILSLILRELTKTAHLHIYITK